MSAEGAGDRLGTNTSSPKSWLLGGDSHLSCGMVRFRMDRCAEAERAADAPDGHNDPVGAYGSIAAGVCGQESRWRAGVSCGTPGRWIIQACEDARNFLINDPDRVRSVGTGWYETDVAGGRQSSARFGQCTASCLDDSLC